MTRRLRVGIVTPGWGTETDDGGLPAVSDLVAWLAARHDVRVFALRHPPKRAPYERGGATVTTLGAAAAAGSVARGRLISGAVAAIRRAHLTEPFDVLHALFADEPGAVCVLAGRLLRVPVMVSVLGGELVALPDIRYGAALGRGGRMTTGLSLDRADLVTVGSSGQEALVRERRPRAPVERLPLGVDLHRCAPSQTPRRVTERTILFAGSLEPVKDPVTLLRAFAIVAGQRSDATLEIAGDGSLLASSERLAGTLGLQGVVRFNGHLPRDELVSWYQWATVLCLSSRHEGQGMVAVEAAACGLPVVGTDVGVMRDLEGAALSVPIKDHVALAEALGEVLDDPARRVRMGLLAREVATRSFDLERTSAAFEDAYRGLHAARRTGR